MVWDVRAVKYLKDSCNCFICICLLVLPLFDAPFLVSPGVFKATYMPHQFMMFLFVHLFALGALDHDGTNLHRLIFSLFLLGLCFKSSKMDI